MAASAQVSKVSLMASGLTCSMCSNSINKALKTLPFISKVEADIKSSSFEVSLKPNIPVDFNKMKMKVEKAGFSVSGFVATVQFDNINVKKGQPLTVDNGIFIFERINSPVLDGLKRIRILNKGFVSAKEYKVNALSEPSAGTYRVSVEN
jgi:copper chaperone CopZ